MRKFRFSLESVLTYRCNIENQKKEELAKALREELSEKKRLESLLEKRDAFLKQKELTFNIGMLQHREAHLSLLDASINKQKRSFEKAQKKVKKKRLQLQEAAKEVKIIENLQEKHYQEYCQEILKEEQKHLDEVGISTYFRREKLS